MNIIEHIWDALQCASKETSTPLYFYGFMDSPAGCRMSIPSSTTSDISQVHITSCCGTSVCWWGLYTILGKCTSFFDSSMKIHFTMQNLYSHEFLQQAFQCYMHHYRCLLVLIEPAAKWVHFPVNSGQKSRNVIMTDMCPCVYLQSSSGVLTKSTDKGWPKA